MVLSLFSVVIRLGVAKILLSLSPSRAANKSPISGTTLAPAPAAKIPPAAPAKKVLPAAEPMLTPLTPVTTEAEMLSLLTENCSPSFFADSSETSAMIASTYTCRGARSSCFITAIIDITSASFPDKINWFALT